jgi:hypothetical protein
VAKAKRLADMKENTDLALIQPANQNPGNNQPANKPDNTPPIPQGKSLGHYYMMANKVKVCSFKLETAGDYDGVVQMSAKLSTLNFIDGECVGFTHTFQTFDSYVQVQPSEGLYWNTAACHGLTPISPQIRSENSFDFVWNKFYTWITGALP